MVGAVGEMASTEVVEDGGEWAVLLQQCHPNMAGSLLIAGRTECNPHCFCCFLCVVSNPPNWGKRPRYIDRQICSLTLAAHLRPLPSCKTILEAQHPGGHG